MTALPWLHRLARSCVAAGGALAVYALAGRLHSEELGPLALALALVPVVLMALWSSGLLLVFLSVFGYTVFLLILYADLAIQPNMTWMLLAAFAAVSLLWMLRTALFSGIWACVIEASRIVFVGLVMLVVLSVLPDRFFPITFPWDMQLVWPTWGGTLLLVGLPLLVGIPAGMAIMGLPYGRAPVLACLAFLSFVPWQHTFPWLDRILVVLFSSLATLMLVGSALANRFSPQILAAIRLTGASWLDVVFRLFLPAVGWSTTWLVLLALYLAFDIRPSQIGNGEGMTVILRLLPQLLLLVYFLLRVSLPQGIETDDGIARR